MGHAPLPTTTSNTAGKINTKFSNFYCAHLLDRYEQILHQHRLEEPALYHLIDLKKKLAANSNRHNAFTEKSCPNAHTPIANPMPSRSPFVGALRGTELRNRIQSSQQIIRDYQTTLNADIIPRTQAHNRKCSHQSLDDEISFRSHVMSEQIRAWRSMLPKLIRQFSKIRDPRKTKSVKHKLTVLMLFGLFAFIFRLSSRREMNRELTGPLIFERLQKLFPEIDSIPHADTLARLLERINPKTIESVHIDLIRDLIKKKKFRKLLINGCLPITIDGAQKLYRDGFCKTPLGVNVQLATLRIKTSNNIFM